MKFVHLVEPEDKYLASYAEAVQEYRVHQVDDYVFSDPAQVDVLEKFRNYKSGNNLKSGRVSASYYWLVSEDEFIGEIVIRHELNDALRRYGGHVGYGIRCSHQKQGYGALMLRLALGKARGLGLERVLITCDDDNAASARVIEKNGGKLQDIIENGVSDDKVITHRYWIEL